MPSSAPCPRDGLTALDGRGDRRTFARRQRTEVPRPAPPVGKAREGRRLSPEPRRMPGVAAATEDVQVNTPVVTNELGAGRVRGIVELPVAGFPVVDAAVAQLRQALQHRGPRGRDE